MSFRYKRNHMLSTCFIHSYMNGSYIMMLSCAYLILIGTVYVTDSIMAVIRMRISSCVPSFCS